MIDPGTAQWIISQGVAVGVLLWFMFRMEKKIEEMTDAIQKLIEAIK